jgi:branched-subunit amino acid aminotransferase/4-amino-4-deoxychorismate lyase
MELNGRPVSTGELAALALYGYGHFTTMLVSDLRVRGLDLHARRLSQDCAALFGADLDLPRVRELVRRTAREHACPTVIRVTVYDPHMDLARPDASVLPHVLVTARPAPDPACVPPPVRLGTRRFSRDTPEVKGTGLFGAIRERRAARLDGHDDALFTTPDGLVSEGPTWNIGFVEGGGLVWPLAPMLDGVTARLVDRVAADLGVPVIRRPVSASAATRMSGAFVTNATTGLRPVAALDGVHLPSSPVVTRLAHAYAELAGDRL